MSDFNEVVVCEHVDEWAVGYGNEGGGMSPLTIHLFRKDRNGEERAHAYALHLCEQSGLDTYIVRQFTDEVFVHLVQILDARTGELRRKYLDDFR